MLFFVFLLLLIFLVNRDWHRIGPTFKVLKITLKSNFGDIWGPFRAIGSH